MPRPSVPVARITARTVERDGLPVSDGNQTRQEIIRFVGELREKFPNVEAIKPKDQTQSDESSGPPSLENLHHRIVGVRKQILGGGNLADFMKDVLEILPVGVVGMFTKEEFVRVLCQLSARAVTSQPAFIDQLIVFHESHEDAGHRPEAKLCSGDSGSRWRSDTGDVHEGEIAISGSRVREENGSRSVIVPWVETIYYGKQQNGYHGGATPQEMVSPLVILMDRTSTYSGLYQCEYPKPEWWLAPPVASAVIEEPTVTIVKPKKPMGLFDEQVEREKKPVTTPVKTKPVPQPTTVRMASRLRPECLCLTTIVRCSGSMRQML